MRKKAFCHFCGTPLKKKICNGEARLFCYHCKEIIYENPVPSTCFVIVDQNDKVLLVKQNEEPQKGLWCLPGGFIELGETPEHGALRKLKEKTGLSGHIDMLLGVTSDHSPQYDTVIMIGYLVKNDSSTLSSCDDASAISYFHKNKLPEIAFESHKNFIRIYYSTYSTGDE